MKQSVRKGRTNRHEKVAQILLSGKQVTPEEIYSVFEGTDQEKVLYRLSSNIHDIRLDGGIIRITKNGRKITSYQLVNYTEFNASGRYIGPQKKVQNNTETKPENELLEV
jgi:hypothetical protein